MAHAHNSLPALAARRLKWDDVYLIGGGPSLKGFDFERLRGRAVVAINDAALTIPWAMALFTLDAHWIANRMNVVRSFGSRAHIAVADDFDIKRLPPKANVYCRVRNSLGLCLESGSLNMGGGNSGFGAFNLAVQMGAKRITLLGYDLRESHLHWHAGYAWSGQVNKDALYRNWAEAYLDTVPQLVSLDVVVLNASLESTIRVFPKVSLDILPLPPLNGMK